MNFNENIMQLRYSWTKPDGTKETWNEISDRVVDNVYSVVNLPKDVIDQTREIIKNKKFIPGGRFLAQSGRDYHQTSNCYTLRAEDTRMGWADLAYKSTIMLMSGGGIGIDYSQLRPNGSSLKSSGGTASGVIPLMKTVNEIGRGVMAGGSRRSAIYGSLNWKHGDIFNFLTAKDWIKEVRELKEKDFDFPAPLDMTNISVILDKEFFNAFDNINHSLHQHAHDVYNLLIKQMVKKSEPGIQIDYNDSNESLRNACFTGDMKLLTKDGYKTFKELCDKEVYFINDKNNITLGKVWCNGKKKIIQLNIVYSGTQRTEIIKCTSDHILFDINNNEIMAKDTLYKVLKPHSNHYNPIETNTYPVVVSIKKLDDDELVYDFTEPETHTGYVNYIKVHNCTEIVSKDDSDVCVLGSINFSKIKDINELKIVTELATLFLLVGTEYTDRPTPKVKIIQEKNRRLGLGIMGLHEWLILKNKSYGRDNELSNWLKTWKDISNQSSKKWANYLNFNIPVAVRACAPNGTISIIGETTSGIEPIFAVAYQRRFLTPKGWHHQYVISPIAEKLVNDGINPNKIEDAYTLSLTPEKRVDFQVFIQEYVDNAISSTINLPKYGNPGNNNYDEFGKMLYSYLPKLRGITCYADGSRGGQPLSVVDFNYAMKHKDKVFESKEECNNGICGI